MTDQYLTEQFEKQFKRGTPTPDELRIFQIGYFFGLGKLDELKEMIEKSMVYWNTDMEYPAEYGDGMWNCYKTVLELIEQIKKESESD